MLFLLVERVPQNPVQPMHFGKMALASLAYGGFGEMIAQHEYRIDPTQARSAADGRGRVQRRCEYGGAHRRRV